MTIVIFYVRLVMLSIHIHHIVFVKQNLIYFFHTESYKMVHVLQNVIHLLADSGFFKTVNNEFNQRETEMI